jgi:acetyltransferase-like isoleucine patch superfamily enzyme
MVHESPERRWQPFANLTRELPVGDAVRDRPFSRRLSGRVRLGANCLVGANSTVLAGVTLGDGTIVSAMSLVHKGTPLGAFVGGVPIRFLRRRGETAR